MYSVHCETCSEETTAETYAAANDFFMEHAEHRHEVELVNRGRPRSETIPGPLAD